MSQFAAGGAAGGAGGAAGGAGGAAGGAAGGGDPPSNSGNEQPDQSAKLFVGRLSPNTTKEDLKNLFSTVGTVLECVIMDKNYGFVHMSSAYEAERAIRQLNYRQLNGSSIIVERSRSLRHLTPTHGKTRSSEKSGSPVSKVPTLSPQKRQIPDVQSNKSSPSSSNSASRQQNYAQSQPHHVRALSFASSGNQSYGGNSQYPSASQSTNNPRPLTYSSVTSNPSTSTSNLQLQQQVVDRRPNPYSEQDTETLQQRQHYLQRDSAALQQGASNPGQYATGNYQGTSMQQYAAENLQQGNINRTQQQYAAENLQQGNINRTQQQQTGARPKEYISPSKHKGHFAKEQCFNYGQVQGNPPSSPQHYISDPNLEQNSPRRQPRRTLSGQYAVSSPTRQHGRNSRPSTKRTSGASVEPAMPQSSSSSLFDDSVPFPMETTARIELPQPQQGSRRPRNVPTNEPVLHFLPVSVAPTNLPPQQNLPPEPQSESLFSQNQDPEEQANLENCELYSLFPPKDKPNS